MCMLGCGLGLPACMAGIFLTPSLRKRAFYIILVSPPHLSLKMLTLQKYIENETHPYQEKQNFRGSASTLCFSPSLGVGATQVEHSGSHCPFQTFPVCVLSVVMKDALCCFAGF